MKRLDGKVVVITGAGSGIGRALAREAHQRGARLAISDVDESGLAETVALLSAAGAASASVRHCALDVSDRSAVMAYAADVREQFGAVHLLVNNAGVSLTGSFAELSWDDIDWILGVNLLGVLHGTMAFLPHLIASGDGNLVNISSIFGMVGVPGQSLYNATKFAVRGLSESLRQEMLLAGLPVRVTCVHPGGIRTGIVRHGRNARPAEHAASAARFDTKHARMEPEQAARIILDGALAGKPRVLVGVDAHLLHQLSRLAGARYQDLLVAATKRGAG